MGSPQYKIIVDLAKGQKSTLEVYLLGHICFREINNLTNYGNLTILLNFEFS